MIDNLPEISGIWERAQRLQRIEDDYDDFGRACRREVIEERRKVMGEEIYENSQGTRSLLWIEAKDIDQEVTERVTERRLRDAIAEDQ